MAIRNVYHDSEQLDLGKLRAEAIRHANGDSRNPGMKVIIHHHKYVDNCDGASDKHEYYEPGVTGGTDTGIRL